MNIARFIWHNQIQYGIVQSNKLFDIVGNWYENPSPGSFLAPLEAVKLLAPCAPSKIMAVGRNYKAHIEEMKNDIPKEPLIFIKPSTAVIGHEDKIIYPHISEQVEYEGELAVVIGKTCYQISDDAAEKYILGYTCAIDVTARDLQSKDNQWSRAKGFNTSCPLGPWIATDIDSSRLSLTTIVNGETRQQGSTADLMFNIPEVISYISQFTTLLPGDVILTGTPAGVGQIHGGDMLEVSISGIGTLKCSVFEPSKHE